jgi:hypothetical protein
MSTSSWPLAVRTTGLQGRAAISHRVASRISEVGTISRKTSDSTDKFNGQNPLDIAITNALELLRGQNFEN